MNLFKYYFFREIREKYLSNITGLTWVFIQPILLLAIYWFVFEKVFHSSSPESKEVGFIVYLAIVFWPWQAFSESVIYSITSVSKSSSLIGKNNIDFRIPVLASITATFFLNITGYVLVLILLSIFKGVVDLTTFLLILIPIIQIYLFTLAIGFILSATQIFIKDTLQIMTTLMTMWFFMTPVIYSETLIPEGFKSFIKLNPLYTPISFIHNAVLSPETLPWKDMFYLYLITIILLYVSIKYFKKLSVYFEDFI